MSISNKYRYCYRISVKSDPTNKFKKEFIPDLKDLNDRKVIDHASHIMKIYPTVDQPLRFYELPKIHKANMPMRLIINSIGAITY